MKNRELREAVCAANLDLVARGLVTYTWGNVSGIDRTANVVAIKPSGVDYELLTPDKIVLLHLDGTAVERKGVLRPSSDTPTHLELYRAFPECLGIAHTHSTHATSFAQACRPVPCFGTTHADHFRGTIPVTRKLTPAEIAGDYEKNTGTVIIEAFAGRDPLEIPAVLVAQHGPFTWGRSPADAVRNSVVLEAVACMAVRTLQLNPAIGPVEPYLVDRHFCRKHGPAAYYGQP
jgi:L-ribulose-5-phosphate 4-epimerase